MIKLKGLNKLASRMFCGAACFIVALALSSCANTPNIKEAKEDSFTVQVLGINDFHGQILPKNNEGGMYQLSAHLLKSIESTSDHSFILHAGDHVGASPAESALLQDEPSISFLNTLSQFCINSRNEKCHVIGTAGNHEFDEGSPEMMRLLKGGNHHKGPFLEAQWQGAEYTNMSANVIDKETGRGLLPPYVVHTVNGVDIGFIGLTLDYTPELVVPGAVDNLVFEDQAEVAQRYVQVLKSQGINAIVIIVHDGTRDEYYAGDTQASSGIDVESKFGKFLAKLPASVDLVVTGHSHRFTNAFFTRNDGSQLLVTQAFSSGRAYADITLTINTASKDVTHSVAQVILANDAPTSSLSESAFASLSKLEALIDDSVGYAQAYTQKRINVYAPAQGEKALGQFIADSHQYNLQSDMAVMNRGGVRASIQAGELRWGELFAVQPFGNQLVVREYTGEQLLSVIDSTQHWSSDVSIAEDGQIKFQSQPLELSRTYTVGGNNYIMNSESFKIGKQIRIGGLDIDATVEYIESLKTPFSLMDSPQEK